MKNIVSRYEEVIWWGLGLGMIVGLVLISEQADVIGRDWREIYRPATLSGDYINYATVANPPYIQLLFWPLSWLPWEVGYVVLMALYLGAFRLAATLSPVNKWLIFPSFPSLWMLVYGQIDAFVALGVALGWWAIRRNRPYWQGAATILLLLKPHIGAPLAIIYLFWQRDRRALLVSGLFLLLSLTLFGFWPLRWLERMALETTAASREAGFASELNDWNNIGAFPYGLLLWPLVLLPYARARKVPAIISATILSSPYAGAYSMLTAMAMPLPLGIYPILSLPLFTPLGYRLIAIAPLALVLYPAAGSLMNIRRKANTSTNHDDEPTALDESKQKESISEP
ncbi:MAG: glycosyltransferase family 87 protein [Chloroflexota bacterium]